MEDSNLKIDRARLVALDPNLDLDQLAPYEIIPMVTYRVGLQEDNGITPGVLHRRRGVLMQEWTVQSALGDHPRIQKFYGGLEADERGAEVWLITQDLSQMEPLPVYLRRQPQFQFDLVRAWRIVVDLAEAFQYLHARNVIHRDLCLQNVFLQESEVILANFERAAILDPTGAQKPWPSFPSAPYVPNNDYTSKGGGCFNLKIAAPELLTNPDLASKASDMWAFGIFIWQLWMAGTHPYAHLGELGQRDEKFFRGWILGGGTPPLAEIDPPEIRAVLQDCWCFNPSKRPRFDSAFIERLFSLAPAVQAEAERRLALRSVDSLAEFRQAFASVVPPPESSCILL